MNGRVEHLEGRLIVSCQTLLGESLRSSFVMDRMTLVTKEDGAVDIRANTKGGIAETQKQMDLPVIRIVERDHEDNKVYTTPTVKEIEELMEIKPEIIVLDAASDLGPGAGSLGESYRGIRAAYLDQLLMADCFTVEEALHVDQLGSDLVRTTLVGYTEQSRGLKIESNDFSIVRKIVAGVKHRVTAEGDINAPEKARQVTELGVFSVIVGPIITRPQLITRSFVQATEAEG